ncbi:MAG: hypothetical protein Kow00124_10160 [Anaerolineae bacterium]
MRRLGILLAAVLLLSVILPAHMVLAQSEPTAVVNTGRLNVRMGPSPGYAVVTVVSLGDELILLGRDAAGSYVKVETPTGAVGWVSTYYIKSSVPISSLPILEEVEPWAYVITGALNLRAGPGLEFEVLDVLPRGKPLGLIGRDARSEWVQVRVDGEIGWVGRIGIAAGVSISSLPVTAAGVVPGTGTTPPAVVPPAAPPPPLEGTTALVNTPRLNVRSGPGAGYAIVTVVSGGDVLKLLGRDSVGSWVYVELADGTKGWVSSFYIQTAIPISSLPVEAETEAVGIINTGVANIRSGPGLEYSVVTTAPLGTRVNLLGRNATTTWLLVRVNGVEGWVGRGLVDTAILAGLLPISE